MQNDISQGRIAAKYKNGELILYLDIATTI